MEENLNKFWEVVQTVDMSWKAFGGLLLSMLVWGIMRASWDYLKVGYKATSWVAKAAWYLPKSTIELARWSFLPTTGVVAKAILTSLEKGPVNISTGKEVFGPTGTQTPYTDVSSTGVKVRLFDDDKDRFKVMGKDGTVYNNFSSSDRKKIFKTAKKHMDSHNATIQAIEKALKDDEARMIAKKILGEV